MFPYTSSVIRTSSSPYQGVRERKGPSIQSLKLMQSIVCRKDLILLKERTSLCHFLGDISRKCAFVAVALWPTPDILTMRLMMGV